MMDFETAQKIVNSELESYSFEGSPPELYDPVRYILSSGGKRLRPSLCLMACSVFMDSVHRAIKPALAFEVFHNFTLLHDDLMDESDLRRGNKTVHHKWDANRAILSGDVMSILAYRILSESGENYMPELLQLFNTTALQVCEGQQWDMNFESRMDVSVPEYLRMIELKTAVLLAASLKAGAICGEAELLEADLLYEFGRNLGIAFQVRDDYLDVFGDPEIFGKKIGNDIVSNKKTFMLIKALELSDHGTRDELMELMSGEAKCPRAKVKKVSSIFSELGLDRIAMEFADSHYSKALQYLDRVNAPDERKHALAGLAGELMERSS